MGKSVDSSFRTIAIFACRSNHMKNIVTSLPTSRQTPAVQPEAPEAKYPDRNRAKPRFPLALLEGKKKGLVSIR